MSVADKFSPEAISAIQAGVRITDFVFSVEHACPACNHKGLCDRIENYYFEHRLVGVGCPKCKARWRIDFNALMESHRDEFDRFITTAEPVVMEPIRATPEAYDKCAARSARLGIVCDDKRLADSVAASDRWMAEYHARRAADLTMVSIPKPEDYYDPIPDHIAELEAEIQRRRCSEP